MYMYGASVTSEDCEVVVRESIIIGSTGNDTYIRFPKNQAILIAKEMIRIAETISDEIDE